MFQIPLPTHDDRRYYNPGCIHRRSSHFLGHCSTRLGIGLGRRSSHRLGDRDCLDQHYNSR